MAKLLGNDIVTQEEFDQFVANTVLPIKLQLERTSKMLNFAFILSALVTGLMILTTAFVILH